MNKEEQKKARLELDLEMIADLETEGGDVKGGLSGSGGAGVSISIVVSRRGGAMVAEAPGGGLNAC